MHLPWIWYNVETKKGVMNMKSVIAIAAMIACRAAFAWAHCDIPMLSFSLSRKQETQLMQKMVEQVRDRSDRLSDRFTRMARIVALLVVGPHAKNLDHVFFLQNLVDEAMLDVDSA